MTLTEKLMALLAGTTSRNPLPTESLAGKHNRPSVEAELMRLYGIHEVSCCKIIKGGKECVVWWIAGGLEPALSVSQAQMARNG